MLKLLPPAVFASLFALLLGMPSDAQTVRITKLEDYNAALPVWGASWAAGKQSMNGYYPSFYTGFAMRSEFPDRIHVRTARGNQTRISVILDEVTLGDYLFDLAKRASFYKKVSGSSGRLNLAPAGAKFVPQLASFTAVIESPVYGILDLVKRAEGNRATESEIYLKSLAVLKALNPGRVFSLNIDLREQFLAWKKEVRKVAQGDANKILANPVTVVASLNGLVAGRINVVDAPSKVVLSNLRRAIDSAVGDENEEVFVASALELFKTVTGSKYDFLTVDAQGDWQPAIRCESAKNCRLAYPEFTTIYPTGSLEGTTTDENGNRINAFATPGLWQFLNYPGREVDNIRDEPYYGFAPKMDYEGIGNGFHNPGVRFWGPPKDLKKSLGIDPSHTTFWAVKRGGVSHGCLRLSTGHVWEMRQIFPVENEKMTKIKFFGNNSQDFDVFDIDGDGQLEVMGVQYMISYGLKGTDGLARREGQNLEVNADKKLAFYETLYGASGVFRVENDHYVFTNPKISYPSYLDFRKKSVKTRVALSGSFPLYEQAYEKDKIQFYTIGEITPENKKLVRLMGRVRGCAPTNDRGACGEEAFDREAREVLQ